jgi:3-oxoisoapionate decarboxylase
MKGFSIVTSSVASPSRLPIGLCVYGIAYSAGLVGKGTPRAHPNPLDGVDFLELAAQSGLSSVELPTTYMAPDEDPAALAAFCARAAELNLVIVSAGVPIETEIFRRHLELIAPLGIKTVRCILSGVLCGDRTPVGGLEGWQRHLEDKARHLQAIAPLAEELGIQIGVENHQDATSEDLIWLCNRVNSPNVGITMDTGNPMAVGEDPVAFAQRVLPHLVHVHLKDYRIMRTEAGYRLFHCAIGAGVVDFAALFQIFSSKPGLRMHIEMAALGERHIRILEDGYWACHTLRPVHEILPMLQRREQAEVDVEWQTPWEAGQEAILGDWEMERLHDSIARMSKLLSSPALVSAGA